MLKRFCKGNKSLSKILELKMGIQEFLINYVKLCEEMESIPREDVLEYVGSIRDQAEVAYIEDLVIQGNNKAIFNTRVTNLQLSLLCECLIDSGSSNLKNVDLQYNHIGCYPDDTNELQIAGISALTSLFQTSALYACHIKSLNLCGNYIDAKLCSRLCTSFHGCTTLETLILKENQIGEEGGLAVAAFLASHNGLQVLDLGDTSIGQDSVIAICSALLYNTKLKDLSLENLLKDQKEEEALQHIAKCLQINQTLTKINLGKQNITDKGAQVLAERLLENSTLKSLSLRCNDIGPTGAEAISALLLKNKFITFLDISCNRISNTGGAAFGAVLRATTVLNGLSLGYNYIENEGLCHIANGLANNNSIEKILLWGNTFGEESAELFLSLTEGRFKYCRVQTDIHPNRIDECIEVAKRSIQYS